jgi:hypothetical protein
MKAMNRPVAPPSVVESIGVIVKMIEFIIDFRTGMDLFATIDEQHAFQRANPQNGDM